MITRKEQLARDLEAFYASDRTEMNRKLYLSDVRKLRRDSRFIVDAPEMNITTRKYRCVIRKAPQTPPTN